MTRAISAKERDRIAAKSPRNNYYTPEEVALLVRLRSQPNPMTFKQIRSTYFPDRSLRSVEVRIQNERARDPSLARTRTFYRDVISHQPRNAARIDPADEDESAGEAFERMVAFGTRKLGEAIDRLLGRCGA